jgi:hypothetical protein
VLQSYATESRMGWRVGGRTTKQCSATAFVRAGCPRALPAGRLHGVGNWCPACRHGGARASGLHHVCCGTPDPPPRPLCAGLFLVRGGNYSCERVVGGGDSSCEEVVGGEAETPRARQRLLVRGGDSSCGTKTSHVGRKLVREASSSSETRRLASEILTRISCPYCSVS